MKTFVKTTLLCLECICLFSCSAQRKLSSLNRQPVSAQLSLANDNEHDFADLGHGVTKHDTLTVKGMDGNDVIIMKAVKDEQTGEMVANDVIDAAVVTARFRNVAERGGRVDLAFKVTVPSSMQDSKWQLRFYPDLFIMDDSLRLDPVVITGTAYRKAQLKGYQQYERFLSSIVQDTTRFINVRQLEIFLQRNIPQIYSFKSDSSEVSDEQFYSYYGVSEKQAVKHYTNNLFLNANNRRKAKVDKMFHRYVKAPIVTEGIRLDTVLVSDNGDFEYDYVQTINTRPKLRKADIVLSGAIFEQDKKIYEIPRSEALTFYISSLSSLTDGTERYLTKIIERRAEANTEGKIDFEAGKSSIKEDLGENWFEIRNIKMTLGSLVENDVFDLDSIVISAAASPEGSYSTNRELAQRRSESVSRYFEKYLNHYRDSLVKEAGLFLGLGTEQEAERREFRKISFIPRCIPENWEDLCLYVSNDGEMTEGDKESFRNLMETVDPDARERLMQGKSYYSHLKGTYYPRLRTVKFNFYLHRKGVVKDTVLTTVPDSVYMRGVQALKDMDYETALTYLRSYEDFNTAVAYTALDRNASALAILSGLEKTAEVNYMLAVIYSRTGELDKAVQCYVTSCRQNPLFVHRGNLDPEISSMIRAYDLNRIFEEPDEFDF